MGRKNWGRIWDWPSELNQFPKTIWTLVQDLRNTWSDLKPRCLVDVWGEKRKSWPWHGCSQVKHVKCEIHERNHEDKGELLEERQKQKQKRKRNVRKEVHVLHTSSPNCRTLIKAKVKGCTKWDAFGSKVHKGWHLKAGEVILYHLWNIPSYLGLGDLKLSSMSVRHVTSLRLSSLCQDQTSVGIYGHCPLEEHLICSLCTLAQNPVRLLEIKRRLNQNGSGLGWHIVSVAIWNYMKETRTWI